MMISITQSELDIIEELASTKESQTDLREKISKRRKLLQEPHLPQEKWISHEITQSNLTSADILKENTEKQSKYIKRIAVECLLDKFIQYPIEAIWLQRRMNYAIHDFLEKYFHETKWKDILALINELALENVGQ